MELKERKKKVLDAAKVAIDELIKVLNEPIVNDATKPDPEKMKTAAQAKRVAFEDALAMLERLEMEENEMAEEGTVDERIRDTKNFAERNSKNGKS